MLEVDDVRSASAGAVPAATARHLLDQPDVSWTMAQAVVLAVTEVAAADAAALAIVHRRGRVETAVSTHASARHADELQYQLGEGPCLDAVWEDLVVRVPDIAADRRWPQWSRAMTERSGFRSMTCHRLFTSRDRMGALTLYAIRRRAFDAAAADHAQVVAAQVAIAVRSAQKVVELEAALASRTVIGEAIGIVMERFGIDEEHAFALLARLSSHSNRKLRDIATEIATTGTTPGLTQHDRQP